MALEPGLTYFKYYSTGETAVVTVEAAADLKNRGIGEPFKSITQFTPRQALQQTSSHARVHATVPADILELARLRIEDDKAQFQDRGLSMSDVVATLVRNYAQGKVSMKGEILKSL